MADVVVGAALGQAGLHRQHRLGAIQRLDLGLLIDAEHDGVLRGVEVEADDVGDLGDQFGSVENLNVSDRHGCTPYSRQALATAEKLIPSSRPTNVNSNA